MHRIEVQVKSQEPTGLFCWADDVINEVEMNIMFSLIAQFKNLPDPRGSDLKIDDSISYRCWFTETGYRKFRKALRKMAIYAEAVGAKWIHLEMEYESIDPAAILYQDPLQVWIKQPLT